jgi:type I restriction enzyme S subunit
MNVNRGTGRQQKLPSGWRWLELGEVCDFVRGVTFDKAQMRTNPASGFNSVLRAGNIQDALNTCDDLIWVPKAMIDKEQYLRTGDVAICLSSGSASVVGKTAYCAEDTKSSVGAFCGILRARGALDNRYLSFWLRSKGYQAWRDLQARGTNIQNLRFSEISKIHLPIPSLSEQRRIAAILDEQMAAVEKARAAGEDQLEAGKALPAAYLRQVFPKEGRELSPGWRWTKLGDLCDSQITNRDPREAPEAKFIYVDISSIDNKKKKIREAKKLFSKEAPSRARQEIKEKDVIVSTTRPGLNAVAIISPELDGQICSTGFCVLRTMQDILIPELLFFFVQTPHFVSSLQDLVRGALYPAVTDSQVRDQLFPLPPLAAQKRFVAVLSEQMASAERLRNDIEKQLHEINTLPAALLRRAFKGEL